MGFKFPYGNEQQLNLNWFIKKFKELLADWQHEQESIDGALDAEIQRAEDALTDVYTARDVTVAAKNDALQAKADTLTAAANAAQYWQNAAASANSAATSAVTALQAAQDAADDAAQTSSDRAGVAADKAAVAADKATVASDKATVAADKAAVSQDKDDVDTMKDAANAAALRSEGWADGTQNGTPVASGSPYYENNAKYYKDQTEEIYNNIPADYSILSPILDPLDILNRSWYPQTATYTYSARKVTIQNGLIRLSIEASGGSASRTIYFSGDALRGVSAPVSTAIPNINNCLPISRLSDLGCIAASCYGDFTDTTIGIKFVSVDENQNVTNIEGVGRTATKEYFNKTNFTIPENATHFALYIYQGNISNHRGESCTLYFKIYPYIAEPDTVNRTLALTLENTK